MPVYISRVDLSGEHGVTIKSALHRGRGYLLSLSEHGVYIATEMIILPQASVRLQLELPDTVEAEAVVTWENQKDPEEGLPPGYGMRLTRVPPETARAIREIMSHAVVPPPRGTETEGESSYTLAPNSRSIPLKHR